MQNYVILFVSQKVSCPLKWQEGQIMSKKIIGMDEGQEQILDHLLDKEEDAITRFEKALEAFKIAKEEGRKVTKEESREMVDGLFSAMTTSDKTQERLAKMGRSKIPEMSIEEEMVSSVQEMMQADKVRKDKLKSSFKIVR